MTDALYQYVLDNSLQEIPLLARLREETSRLPGADMQIPPHQGQIMGLLARIVGARRIVEIGTFTGYSSTVMALTLPEDGQITCCDRSSEYTAIARKYWKEAGVEGRVELILGNAQETLATLIGEGRTDSYDMAFIDADKEGYDNYYEACLKLVRPGGLILLDNMLWYGNVADAAVQDADTVAIRFMNAKIHEDGRVDSCLLPIADGLTVARKK
jgi:predicted O-methyltransferase YrrM